MNDFLYNKKIAAIILIFIILFSIFVIGGNQLKKEAGKVMDIFYGGNEYDISVEAECLNILGDAGNLLVVAGRYLPQDDKAVQTIDGATKLDGMEDGRYSPAELADSVMTILNPAAYDLLTKLESMDISQKDMEYLIVINGNFDAALRKIDLSGYNAAALGYHRSISNPYTGLIAGMRGVRKLPIIAAGRAVSVYE